jgi:hypothetical protein
MRRLLPCFLVFQTALLLAAEKPTWSRYATRLTPCFSAELIICHSASSPGDGKIVALRTILKYDDLSGELIVQATQDKNFSLAVDPDWNLWHGVDALWSPRSNYLVVTGDLNAYTESTRVYEVTRSGVKLLDVFREANADMLQSFRPCKAFNIDREDCERQERDPFFNFAAIAWSGPSSLVIMSEVPCSSNYGGFMCQIMGYEIDVSTGHILRRMDARQFKAQWQHAMAWSFRVPEPPKPITSAEPRP